MSQDGSHGSHAEGPADLAQGIAEAVELRRSCLKLIENGEFDRAEPILAESVVLLRSLAALDPHIVGPQLGKGLTTLAGIAAAGSDHVRARRLTAEALPLLRQGVAERPSEYVAALNNALRCSAESLCSLGEPESALPMLDEAIELLDHPELAPDPVAVALLGDARLTADFRELLRYRCLRTRLSVLQRLHRTDEALIAAFQMAEIARRLADHVPERYSTLIARALTQLALMHRQSDKAATDAFLQEALPYWYAAAGYRRERLGPDPDAAPPYQRSALVTELMGFTTQLEAFQRGAEALPYAREAVNLARSLARQQPDKYQRLFESCQKVLARLEHRTW